MAAQTQNDKEDSLFTHTKTSQTHPEKNQPAHPDAFSARPTRRARDDAERTRRRIDDDVVTASEDDADRRGAKRTPSSGTKTTTLSR